jgi:hypothetical protein
VCVCIVCVYCVCVCVCVYVFVCIIYIYIHMYNTHTHTLSLSRTNRDIYTMVDSPNLLEHELNEHRLETPLVVVPCQLLLLGVEVIVPLTVRPQRAPEFREFVYLFISTLWRLYIVNILGQWCLRVCRAWGFRVQVVGFRV